MERTTKRGMPEFMNSPPIPKEKKSPSNQWEMEALAWEKNQPENFNILACDPSICAWGYAVINPEGIILKTGCAKTAGGGKKMRIRKGDDTVRRVNEINVVLLALIKDYNIRFIVSELPHGSQSASAALTIGLCIGMMQSKADDLGIAIEWYSEGEAKKAGYGKMAGEKHEMITAMTIRFKPQKWQTGIKYVDEAVADALAIFNVARKNSAILKVFLR